MPAEVLTDPLGIGCEFSDGRRRRLLVGESGAPELAGDLLTGLAGLVWPHGELDAANSVGVYLTGLRDICQFMAAREAGGGAAALTRAVLAEYWMQAGLKRERATRRMLLGFAAGDGGTLGAGVAALAAGRRFSPGPGRDPLAPYEHEQWAHLQATCRQIADESFAVHQRAVAAAGRGHDPADGQWSQDSLRWLMLHRGPLSAAQAAGYLGVPARHVHRRGGISTVLAELFPDADVVLAYQLLLGCYCGVVPDGIADLGVGDIDWAGDAAVLLTYIKRRTAAESVTLPRRAVRLLEQWLQHSAITRSSGPARLAGQLWLHCSSRSDHRWQTAVDSERQRLWGDRHGIAVDRRRVRTTNLSLRDRGAWHGSSRSLIDPNHSAQVEADYYLTAATPAQQEQVDSIIEQGQGDMVRRAAPPAVLSGTQLAGLAAALPATLTGLGLDAAAAGALVSGSQDVFVASCTDPLSGRHGPAGKPCPARPWVCLLCPLAIFAPRHAANLLRLKAFFARQWRQMPNAQFMATFGPYAARIDQILRLYPPGALAELGVTIRDDDSGLPLRPEEGTR
jgi:hypothetical protein